MKISILLAFVILAGCLVAIQGGINSNLGKYLAHPLQAAFISFVAGLLGISFFIIVLGIGFPKLAALTITPKYLLFGGLLGAIYITLSIIVIPKIGVANFVVAVVCGQMLMSLIIDHYGWFNVSVQAIDMRRLIGISLVIIGVLILNKTQIH